MKINISISITFVALIYFGFSFALPSHAETLAKTIQVSVSDLPAKQKIKALHRSESGTHIQEMELLTETGNQYVYELPVTDSYQAENIQLVTYSSKGLYSQSEWLPAPLTNHSYYAYEAKKGTLIATTEWKAAHSSAFFACLIAGFILGIVLKLAIALRFRIKNLSLPVVYNLFSFSLLAISVLLQSQFQIFFSLFIFLTVIEVLVYKKYLKSDTWNLYLIYPLFSGVVYLVLLLIFGMISFLIFQNK